MVGNLESILDGTDTDEIEETAEQVEQTDTPEPEEVETGEQAEETAEEQTPEPEPEPEPSATPAEEPEEVKGLRAALKAERRKRQEAEQQAQIKQFDPASFYEDPSNIQHFVQEKLAVTAINMSREFAKHQFEDYDEMEELFAEEAERNPALVHQLKSHPAPALFAYQTAKQLKTVREAQDGSLEARIRAEVEAKVRAEYEAKQKKAAAAVPPDLAGARSVSGDDSPPDESIDAILNSRTR